MSEPTVATSDVEGLYVVTGEPLSVEDKFNLLQELWPNWMIGRQNGEYGVWSDKVCVGDNFFVYSVMGRGEKIEDAISNLFEQLTTLPADRFVYITDPHNWRYVWDAGFKRVKK